MSGGSGYVLSREAVRRFVEIAFPNKDLCVEADLENEDVEVGVCLANVNVTTADTRDIHLKGRFMPFPPENHLTPINSPDFWYWVYRYYGSKLDVSARKICPSIDKINSRLLLTDERQLFIFSRGLPLH